MKQLGTIFLILLVSLGLGLIFGIVSWVTVPAPTPAETPKPIPPTPTPKPETTKPQGITGTVTLAPEAEGKIELKHQLLWGFKESPYSNAPRIKLEIKNIANEEIAFSKLFSVYDVYSFKLVSKDKNGTVLEEKTPDLRKSLRPKEIRTYEWDLFPSDETALYEIIVEYRGFPEIAGKFVSNPELPEIEAQLKISHRIQELSGGILKVFIYIENIGNESLPRTTGYIHTSVFKGDPDLKLYLEIIYKDAEGKILEGAGKKEALAGMGYLFIPGSQRFIASDIPDLAKVKSYEIFLSLGK